MDYYTDNVRSQEKKRMNVLLMISQAAAETKSGTTFLDVVKKVNDAVSSVVWGWPALILLLVLAAAVIICIRIRVKKRKAKKAAAEAAAKEQES